MALAVYVPFPEDDSNSTNHDLVSRPLSCALFSFVPLVKRAVHTDSHLSLCRNNEILWAAFVFALLQIPPSRRRRTLPNVLCCFIIYRGFTQLSIFRLCRHCTTLHLVCMPAWWIMGNVVLWALCHSWGRVRPPKLRQSIWMQPEITAWLVILEQLVQPVADVWVHLNASSVTAFTSF